MTFLEGVSLAKVGVSLDKPNMIISKKKKDGINAEDLITMSSRLRINDPDGDDGGVHEVETHWRRHITSLELVIAP